jgi:hypothetical protein
LSYKKNFINPKNEYDMKTLIVILIIVVVTTGLSVYSFIKAGKFANQFKKIYENENLA